MASLWQKTLFYLGLVDEDQAESGVAGGVGAAPVADPGAPPPVSVVSRVRPPGTVAGRRVEPPSSQRRRVSPHPDHAEAGLYVHPGGARSERRYGTETAFGAPRAEADVIVARNFSDAQTLADGIRSGRPIVLDLRSTEPEMVRRLVDFASGLTYALDGKMAKIAQGVILVTPAGVTISPVEQDRLAALGLFRPASR